MRGADLRHLIGGDDDLAQSDALEFGLQVYRLQNMAPGSIFLEYCAVQILKRFMTT